MSREYSIVYKTENLYENLVKGALWQFLIIPEENESQEFITIDFSNSLGVQHEFSINGFGFKTIRVHPRQQFKEISFEASFKLIKREVNPFDFTPSEDIAMDYEKIGQLDFKVDFGPYLQKTHFTSLPKNQENIFLFDKTKSIFENLQNLNHWTSKHLSFVAGVTDVNTTLEEVMTKQHGVCQDFTHLFCAISRKNGIPARYVSGYLHQGNGYFGDSQMHAWAEAYIPNIGWVGFDTTNGLMANTDHIKVAHGKDYDDCSPLRGVVYSTGKNQTSHSVQVSSQQQQ